MSTVTRNVYLAPASFPQMHGIARVLSVNILGRWDFRALGEWNRGWNNAFLLRGNNIFAIFLKVRNNVRTYLFSHID